MSNAHNSGDHPVPAWAVAPPNYSTGARAATRLDAASSAHTRSTQFLPATTSLSSSSSSSSSFSSISSRRSSSAASSPHLPCPSPPPLQQRRAKAAPAPRTAPRAEMVHVSVPLLVEAPPPLCFALFSDLARMPDWSSTLQAVARDPDDPTYSTWAFAWRGVRLSWRARDAPLAPADAGRVIRWAAVSGLPHRGEVTFAPANPNPAATTTPTRGRAPPPTTTTATTTTITSRPASSSASASSSPASVAASGGAPGVRTKGRKGEEEEEEEEHATATLLTLSVDYDVAQLLAAVARVPFVSNFVESAIRADLQRFRAYALRANRAKRRRDAASSANNPSS